MKNSGKDETRISDKKSSRKKGAIIFVAASVIVLAGLSAYYVSAKNAIAKWDDKIYPGVTVQNIDIGGMTKKEAEEKLKSEIIGAINDKKLPIEVQDKKFELVYSDIEPDYDIDYTVNEAYNFGKDYGVIHKYIAIKSKEKADIEMKFSYNEDKLNQFEKDLIDKVNESPKNATILVNGDSVSVQPEVDGVVIDEDKLDSQLKKSIDGIMKSQETVVIEPELIKADITSEDLSRITGVMSSFSTSYGTSAPGRCNNIELATRKINGTIVMPGETFSFNEVVGPRTSEHGFKEAGTYVGNKVEPGIGGGICQVSTTLYRAIMRANIRSTERTNHSMAVGYAKPGLDATVADGYLDYKFKNTYDFPIYIEGITGGKVVTYNIYGDPSALDGKTYDMTSDIVETMPAETKIVEDNTLDEGKQINEGGGMTGYRTISYQITYENGVETNREIVSRDTYNKVDAVIKKGTKPLAPVDNTPKSVGGEAASGDTATTSGNSSTNSADSATAQPSDQAANSSGTNANTTAQDSASVNANTTDQNPTATN